LLRYQYDGLGRRVSKSGPATLVPGGFVRYMYDAAHHLIGEYKADGGPSRHTESPRRFFHSTSLRKTLP
jgi:YD repeat-containing protein